MSLFTNPRLLPAFVALPLLAGCYGDRVHHHDDGYSNTPPPSSVIEQATIDTDQTLEFDADSGAGVFIEYQSGGTYRVTTACDTTRHGDCYWDILATPLDGAGIKSATPIDLESGDDSVSFASDTLRLVALTGKDFDGFTLQTGPGAVLEVDALLDNAPANHFFFWVGDGALHSGAPSNPLDLVPSED
jgi:hypothetical protein